MTTTTKQDFEIMSLIANRALILYEQCPEIHDEKIDVMMDIEAANDTTPLDLAKFLHFPDGDFGHDMLGIRRYMNRATGALEGCFLPRCALPTTSSCRI